MTGTQTTEVNSCISRKQIVPYGVPHCFVLGPLLFLIIIHKYISHSSKEFDFYLFADDTNGRPWGRPFTETLNYFVYCWMQIN